MSSALETVKNLVNKSESISSSLKNNGSLITSKLTVMFMAT
jgi:hypothetical protein